jgi:hypothetical protein
VLFDLYLQGTTARSGEATDPDRFEPLTKSHRRSSPAVWRRPCATPAPRPVPRATAGIMARPRRNHSAPSPGPAMAAEWGQPLTPVSGERLGAPRGEGPEVRRDDRVAHGVLGLTALVGGTWARTRPHDRRRAGSMPRRGNSASCRDQPVPRGDHRKVSRSCSTPSSSARTWPRSSQRFGHPPRLS